jgi:hypothetical protein
LNEAQQFSAKISNAPGIWLLVLLFVISSAAGKEIQAQVRGLYPAGMSATNSGVTPESGFTYSNVYIIYARSTKRGTKGEITARGDQSVHMDMNSLIWVSKRTIAGGAKFSMIATIPVAKNSLTSDTSGPISGGKGLADSFYQFVLGWQKKRVAFRTTYGFLAPTGRFKAGANDNVGSGYWTHTVSSGQTFFLTKNKATTLSAFQMYEVHTKQKVTDIHPGDAFSLDYSLMQSFPLSENANLQVGLAGYEQYQTTDKTGPSITPVQAKEHYKVNAIGFAANLTIPKRRLSFGVKYFKEFANKSTFQGYSFQLSGGYKF